MGFGYALHELEEGIIPGVCSVFPCRFVMYKSVPTCTEDNFMDLIIDNQLYETRQHVLVQRMVINSVVW